MICISEFAKKHQLTLPQAFNYLKRWEGIDFLDKGYDVEHLFSIEDAVDDLTAYCKKSLARHKVPAVFKFVDTIDMNASGKLVRN